MKNYFLLFITFFILTPSLADSISNRELLKACKDSAIGPKNFCYGFIIASSNAAQFYRNIVDVEDEYIDICIPKNISTEEIVKEYIAWGEKNSSLIDSPAFIGVSASLSTKYSCPPKKAKKPELK